MSYLLNPYILGAPIEATGGYLSYITVGSDIYAVHKFTDVGTSSFNVTKGTGEVEYLIVAGGGSGGGSSGVSIAGGGGGAGGVISGTTTMLSGLYNVVVGSGGTGKTGFVAGTNGGNSSFNGLTAIGGGYGGTWTIAPTVGGSGGGAGENGQGLDGAAGTAGQGFAGGNDLGYSSGAESSGGGGGGAGQSGSNVSSLSQGGKGGNGIIWPTGSGIYYGGGGGGAGSSGGGASGLGGGGAGRSTTTGTGGNGTPNTGGGGGGSLTNASEAAQPGGNGGSGIIIIRYKVYTSPTYISAYGGNSVQYYTDYGNNAWFIHRFTSTGSQNFVISSGTDYVNYLVVGGGGAGGNGADGANNGGGGGAGGFVSGVLKLTSGTHSVTVGAGGAQNSMANGSNSVFSTITALGGGGGGGRISGGSNRTGNNGASGGGGGPAAPNGGGLGTSGQGNNGAAGNTSSPFQGGGGGGAGQAGNVKGTGHGGDGLQSSIGGTTTYYAGGGGGGADSNPGPGGLGGGASGVIFSGTHPLPATPNTGGGGGGGASRTFSMFGSQGGSGIVIVRYPAENLGIVTDGLVLHLDAGIKQSYSGSGTTWYDLSGNNRNAIIYGTNTYTSTYGGRFEYLTGQATDYISLPASALRATASSYTIEFWMNPITPPGSVYMHSVSNGTDHNYFIVQQNSNNTLSRWGDTTSLAFTPSQPMQLVLVRNGSNNGTFYRNGAATSMSTSFMTVLSSAADNGWILNQEQDALGGGFDASQNFRGSFMSVRVYNRALSTGEISQNFNALKSRYGL